MAEISALAQDMIQQVVRDETAAEFRRIFDGVLHTPGGHYYDDGTVDCLAPPKPVDFDSERVIASFILDGSRVPLHIRGKVTVASDASHVLLQPGIQFARHAEGYNGQRQAALRRQLASMACVIVEDGYGKTGWYPGRRNPGITENGVFDYSQESDAQIAAMFNWWQAYDGLQPDRRVSMVTSHHGQPMTGSQQQSLMDVFLSINSLRDNRATIDIPQPANGMFGEVVLWSDEPMVPDHVLLKTYERREVA